MLLINGQRMFTDNFTYSVDIDCDDESLAGEQSRIDHDQVGNHVREAVAEYFKGREIECFGGCVYMPNEVESDTEDREYCWKLRGVDPGEDGASMVVYVNREGE